MSARYTSQHNVDPSPLAQPLHLVFSGRTVPSRFLKSAMTERHASWNPDPNQRDARGVPSKELINLYRRWGEGGFGIIVTGNILVDNEQLEARGNMIVTPDAPFSGPRFEAHREMAKAAKAHGSLFLGQLNHPGRQVDTTMHQHPISASDVKLDKIIGGFMQFAQPRAATQEDIDAIIAAHVHAAEYLQASGYDGVQLHAAHGYLLAQFLAKTTNRREDKYGGSLENRARLLVEIIQGIRKRLAHAADFIVSVKLNSVEFQHGGFSPEDAKRVCKILEENRVDFVELSGGTYEELAFHHRNESTKAREAFFLEFADMITPELKETKAYVTGGLRSAGGMVNALKTVDGIGLARPAAQEPDLPKAILAGKVSGAIEQSVPAEDGLFASGSQLRQLGKGEEPIDLSVEENLEVFQRDKMRWIQGFMADQEGKFYDYPDIHAA